MCKECGCGLESGHGVHAHVGADGKTYYHSHDGSGHAHSHTVDLKRAILADNDRIAEANRDWLKKRKIACFNLISSPGAGKTTLLCRTLELLEKLQIPTAVIVGDQYGEIDAERMRKSNFPVTQIQVHESCHLNAQQIADSLDRAVPDGTQLLLIENVGNLVCPVAFDLGEDEKIALLSTPEGEEKPLKYPGLFSKAKLVLLTKCDLAEVLEWNREQCLQNVRRINPGAGTLPVSARNGEGMDGWIEYVKNAVKRKQSI